LDKNSKSTQNLHEDKKPKTREEIYKEFKKKRLIKNIEVATDIDEEFKALPKRLRTRITNKQMEYIKNNTTMGDIIGHLLTNEKSGIVKAPKEKSHKYVSGRNKAEEVNRMMNKTVDSKAKMTEMEYLQKKNQMLNYFVDRRKKKKPSAMQKAKQKALDKLKQTENKSEDDIEGEGNEISNEETEEVATILETNNPEEPLKQENKENQEENNQQTSKNPSKQNLAPQK